MTAVRISCPVNPSEDEEKVRSAVLSIFPDAELVLNDGRLEGEATLDRFSKAIRRQKILDATRAVMIMNSRGNTTRLSLNKQVATVGKVSFADKRPVLGAIEVTIEDDDLMALIDRVAPITVDGEEVIQ
ncbi:MAG: RNA-binding domain-containing protein [Candidatus Methanomethylophilaceae archaeon]|nr:RNA-binding domain-containing protein [Candidatus Methanomethylophilaceae archaeon]MDY5872840.1 RNA-binding domain-containing protein [Candidatus Methanomethylophilaceae archaeon]